MRISPAFMILERLSPPVFRLTPRRELRSCSSYTLRSAVDHMGTATRNDGTTRGVRIMVSRAKLCWIPSRFWHRSAPPNGTDPY